MCAVTLNDFYYHHSSIIWFICWRAVFLVQKILHTDYLCLHRPHHSHKILAMDGLDDAGSESRLTSTVPVDNLIMFSEQLASISNFCVLGTLEKTTLNIQGSLWNRLSCQKKKKRPCPKCSSLTRTSNWRIFWIPFHWSTRSRREQISATWRLWNPPILFNHLLMKTRRWPTSSLKYCLS